MTNKVRTCFSRIEFDKGVFKKASFEPTLINFIYGKNGSGKTTISRCISNDSISSDWAPGVDKSEVKVMVYNEDFISDNIQSYGNIPGVFTITKQSAEDKAKIEARNSELQQLNDQLNRKEGEINDIEDEYRIAEKKYTDEIWQATETLRKAKYPNTQTGYKKDMGKFVNKLETTQPVGYDEEELDALYEMVHGNQGNLMRADEYLLIDVPSFSNLDILKKKIVGLSDTPFADFVKKLGALDWVTVGHQKYHHDANNTCPYCQQRLPDDFEEKLASCYDEEYKKDLELLREVVSKYQYYIDATKTTIQKNTSNPFKSELKGVYEDACKQLVDGLSYIWTTLQLKLDSPGTSYTINDISNLIANVNGIANQINEKVKEHNSIIADIPGKQEDCNEKVFQLMAFVCKDTILKRNAARAVQEKVIKDRKAEYSSIKGQVNNVKEEISQLNKVTVNTTAVKDSINALIKSSGFQGFYLREKPGAQYVYELVRDNGDGQPVTIARDLSEGERHFIAFLYFYHTVIGSQSGDGKVVPKIVVIDDPVSSLDSESMFIVAALTRELIGVCYNNFRMSLNGTQENYVKQFFCLTHNPYFFREISYNRLPEYECASFFEIKKKSGNKSIIEPCTENSSEVGGRIINRSPVRSNYESLWNSLKTEDNPESLMVVMRQILEYYFIQMCGYKTGTLRNDILDRNEELFVQKKDDGSTDRTDYIIAAAMLSLLDSGANGFNEGLYYDGSTASVDQMRTVFRRLFELQGQQQHYYMMMGE